MQFDGKHILVTGGTGSLGKVLLRRLLAEGQLTGGQGLPARIVIFSRDEAKQAALKAAYDRDETFERIVRFHVGDVRDYASIAWALDGIDIVFNAAALKQVPTCEYFPLEAVRTNIVGPENIVRAIQERKLPVKIVIGISTDKACKPVNVMGMTKAIQERIFLSANERCPGTRFICVRYGNVLASRGSVIPLFREQIKAGGPVTITAHNMTRFLLSLDAAVDTVFAATAEGLDGETYIPRIPSARVWDVAIAMIGDRPIDVMVTGVRPGEKTDEILISEEEIPRAFSRGAYYVINSVLSKRGIHPALKREYSSADSVMDRSAVTQLLQAHGLLDD